jgi:hypothetical protein
VKDDVIPPTRRLWRDPDKGPFYVELYWMEEDGDLVPYGITILTGPRPDEPYNPLLTATEKREVIDPETGEPSGARETTGYVLKRRRLTREDLLRLGFGRLIEEVLESEAAFDTWRAGREKQRREAMKQLAEKWRNAPKRPGRPRKWGPDELGQIARAYDRDGLAGVRDWYSDRTGDEVEASTARGWVKQAQNVGIPVRRKRKRSK